jgi:ribonuclease R
MKHPRTATGIVKRHPDGFGFLVPDDNKIPDVYVPRHEMKGVMTNDKVRARLMPEAGGKRLRGGGLEVLTRSFRTLTGKVEQTPQATFVMRDTSLTWGQDAELSVPFGMSLRAGEWVIARIQSYPDEPAGLTAEVVSILGKDLLAQMDSVRMVHAYNIPHEFSAACLHEAGLLPGEVTAEDRRGRRDLRSLHLVTIDGKTAKDFDDAVYVESLREGFRLIVAIADVSHYVKPGTALDRDAYERGNSTYFPNFVAPMLPEKLSNELCSLKPQVDRLCLVADVKLNFRGEKISAEFYEAVMHSKARVTYGQAQEIVDGVDVPELRHVAKDILRAADLAKILMSKRFREGSLDLDIPETQVEIDESGEPVDIQRSERLFAHRLIEELMLLANVAVAEFFREHDVEAIYRVHEPPKSEALEMLVRFLGAFGYKRGVAGDQLQKKLMRALEHFAGTPKEAIVNILTLRSMSQAKYSADNIGHFGLAFADYTHFTSPIRRYPDLIVHRLLKSKILSPRQYPTISRADIQTAGQWLSATEQRSVKAERQIVSIKKARLMQRHLGEEFDGFVSSVTKFGIFVLLRQFEVDGLVRAMDLGHEEFDFDDKTLRLVGRNSGRAYCLGDSVKVQVARVDVEQGQVDFALPHVPRASETRGDKGHVNRKSESRAHPSRDHAEKRGPHAKDRGRFRKARFRKPRRKN